jgi:ribosomal protein S6--L-glutamate ligase
MHFLVLATSPQRDLIKAIQDAGHTYDVHDPRRLYLYVSESENGYDSLYDGLASLEIPVRLKAKSYDAVISRIGAGLDYGANILTHLAENMGIYTTQTGAGLLTASNKLRTTMKLSSHGIRVPRTVGAYSPLHPDFLIKKVGGLPAVAKTLTGSQGRGVIILKDEEQTNSTLHGFWRAETPLKLQQYIEGGKRDVRAIIIGSEVVSSMERTGKKDFRANLALGAVGSKIELTDEQKEMCVKASQALGLDFSGVDLMLDEEKKAYVIEVNGAPGNGIIRITGHNHFVDLVKFIEKKLGKESKDTKVESTEKAQVPLTALEEQALKKQLRDEKEILLAENEYLRKQAEEQERRKKFPGLYKMLGM